MRTPKNTFRNGLQMEKPGHPSGGDRVYSAQGLQGGRRDVAVALGYLGVIGVFPASRGKSKVAEKPFRDGHHSRGCLRRLRECSEIARHNPCYANASGWPGRSITTSPASLTLQPGWCSWRRADAKLTGKTPPQRGRGVWRIQTPTRSSTHNRKRGLQVRCRRRASLPSATDRTFEHSGDVRLPLPRLQVRV